MNEFLAFRKMITPGVIQIIFLVFGGLAGLTGLVMIFNGGIFILAGLILMVVGPLMVRIWCELIIILFRIYDELVAMRTGVARSRRTTLSSVMPKTMSVLPELF